MSILFWAGQARGDYILGIEKMALASTNEEYVDAWMKLWISASDCYIPAMLAMGEILEKGIPKIDTRLYRIEYALAWYMRAQSLGAKVEDDIVRIRNRLTDEQLNNFEYYYSEADLYCEG